MTLGEHLERGHDLREQGARASLRAGLTVIDFPHVFLLAGSGERAGPSC